ncbi:MAG: 50S ribosomal protein L21 [Patescibacteria group bacterium]
MFAVIKTGGKQYLVTQNQTLKVEKIAKKEGEKFLLSDVLLVGDESSLAIGAPHVKNAAVEVEIIKQAKSDKIRMMRYHSKVRRHRSKGHRQLYTEVKIISIKK